MYIISGRGGIALIFSGPDENDGLFGDGFQAGNEGFEPGGEVLGGGEALWEGAREGWVVFGLTWG